MFMGKRGLFGMKKPYGTPQQPPMTAAMPGTQGMPEMPVAGQGMSAPVQPTMDEQEVKKPGLGTRLLGEGWEAKAAAIGGALRDGDGGRSIAEFHRMNQMREQAAQNAQMQQQQAMAERENAYQDWIRKQEYERNNPKPVNNDTENDINLMRELLPPDQFQQYMMNNHINPQFFTGPDGRRYANPTMPTAPVGRLTPIGPAQQPTGQFSAPQMTVSPMELDALVRKFGPNEVQRRLDSGQVAVRN